MSASLRSASDRATTNTTAPEAFPAPATTPGSGLTLQVGYPNSHVAVIHAIGEIDESSRSRLSELIRRRLASLIDVLVIDLSGVEFLSLSGLELLVHAARHAPTLGITMRFVVDTPAVHHAFRAAKLHQALECHSSLTHALSANPAGPTSMSRTLHTP